MSKQIYQNFQVVKHEEGSFSSCQHDSKPSNGQPCCVYGGESCRMCRYTEMNTTRISSIFSLYCISYWRFCHFPVLQRLKIHYSRPGLSTMLTSITLKSKRFSDVFKWYRNETLGWSLCFLFLYTVVLCAIGYHLHNLKNAKDTHGRKLLSVKTQDKTCNVTKSNTLSWVFSTFLNCTNGTNLRKASHIFSKRKHLKDCEECFLFYQKSYFFLRYSNFVLSSSPRCEPNWRQIIKFMTPASV